jgi:hypothetical protein
MGEIVNLRGALEQKACDLAAKEPAGKRGAANLSSAIRVLSRSSALMGHRCKRDLSRLDTRHHGRGIQVARRSRGLVARPTMVLPRGGGQLVISFECHRF